MPTNEIGAPLGAGVLLKLKMIQILESNRTYMKLLEAHGRLWKLELDPTDDTLSLLKASLIDLIWKSVTDRRTNRNTYVLSCAMRN